MRKVKARHTSPFRWRILIPAGPWRRFFLIVFGIPALVAAAILGYYYFQFSSLIEARLHGERDAVIPRVFARPLTLHSGQGMSQAELVGRLNDVGYTEKARVERPGEFALDRHAVIVVPRGGDRAGKIVRAVFAQPAVVKAARNSPPPAPRRIDRLEIEGRIVDKVTLDAPMLTALVTGSREKRRRGCVGCSW